MPNALTTDIGLRVGPLLLETLIAHYLERLKRNSTDQKSTTRLRQDQLLYDEVFNVVKAFLRAASFHTVEDVQGFSNTRTPSPPWIHVVRLVVPMSCCNNAASHLVKALGGADVARQVVGGVKWWQVRGLEGVDAQWIVTKKDWQEAKRRHKMQQTKTDSPGGDAFAESSTDSEAYNKEMDGMRCILYAHGGGYYFGSVDQERYSIQRHARKINGRVFAVNYRLAPQYPFPCALHDLLAAYLFLIRPPPGAAHCAVDPLHIVIAGDSAGGGLSLALLQVIRDSELPMPAGGVLISPWCDLTHSFPSVLTNTATDVIPPWGLSLQKPSVLWPPPSDEMSRKIHDSIRSRIRQMFYIDHNLAPTMTPDRPGVAVGKTTHRSASQSNQVISLVTRTGETLTIDQQVHLYTQNSLLSHPLISPALSYLGGLPPLLIISSDKEVLRDEIIYVAHKAANPERYPIQDEARTLYPSLVNIEGRYRPTKVHLQVYDDTAHVLPVLFSFTTPAKFCFRAIATFCKHVIRIPPSLPSPIPTANTIPSMQSSDSLREAETFGDVKVDKVPNNRLHNRFSSPSPKRSFSTELHRALSNIRHTAKSNTRDDHRKTLHDEPVDSSESSPSDVGGPRFQISSSHQPGGRTAGDPGVYDGSSNSTLWADNMIRERVSTQGVIRALEAEHELPAFTVPPEDIGKLSEPAIRRYLDARAKFDKKFRRSMKAIDKHRIHNLELDRSGAKKNMNILRPSFMRYKDRTTDDKTRDVNGSIDSEHWSWAWVLDEQERPPPSSIASRRDTAEARRLAKIADESVFQNDKSLSGNHFWSLVVNFFTVAPDREMLAAHGGAMQIPRISRLLGRIPRVVEGEHADQIHIHI